MTFSGLDALEKITVRICPSHVWIFTRLIKFDPQYCNNVLLQEAILQMLLWRTGQRTCLGLLPTEEEHRLHTAAIHESEKSNWVHDVIRRRQAAEKSMLQTGKSKAGSKTRAKGGDGGSRGRTRGRT